MQAFASRVLPLSFPPSTRRNLSLLDYNVDLTVFLKKLMKKYQYLFMIEEITITTIARRNYVIVRKYIDLLIK